MREFQEQIGFLTIAQNTDVDYLNLAYLQAKNIKQTQKYNSYCLVVDEKTKQEITNSHKKVFDYIITLPVDMAKNEMWKQSNEWQVFNLTPFKETIKLESDLLFPRDISHWLDILRMREVCFSYHCKDYQNNLIKDSPYRNTFRKNSLPDIYTGMYYFRYSFTATKLFNLAKNLFANWQTVQQNLVQCEKFPSTDLVFAIAVKILGEENCIIPTIDFFNFIHMKSGINGWGDGQDWTDFVNVESDDFLRINNLNQYFPVHYHVKNFIS